MLAALHNHSQSHLHWCLLANVLLAAFWHFFLHSSLITSQRETRPRPTPQPLHLGFRKVLRLTMTSNNMIICCCYKIANFSSRLIGRRFPTHTICRGFFCFVVVVIFSPCIKLSVSKSKAVWAIVLHYSCSCLNDASNLSVLFTAGCNLQPFTEMKIHCVQRMSVSDPRSRAKSSFYAAVIVFSSSASFFILIYTYGMESDGNF